MIVTRTFLNKKYNLNRKWWNTAHDRLLDHLSDYMDITETKEEGSIYKYIIEGELPEEIPPLPRDTKLTKQKKQDYTKYTKEALGTEFKYNSRAKIARGAIRDFGEQKYSHRNVKVVTRRYVSEPFKEYAEEEENSDAWVWYETYTPLDSLALDRWIQIMKEERITEKDQAKAFRKFANDENISLEIGYYKRAMNRFIEEFGDFTVKVPKYKCKCECGE